VHGISSRFARIAESVQRGAIQSLRDEICSAGGMQSLLDLFQSRGIASELKVIVALAVAYLLPSFQSPDILTACSIVKCLQFLFTTPPAAPKGEEISRAEMCYATATGLTVFWFNILSPSIGMITDSNRSFGEIREPTERPSSRLRQRRVVQQQAGAPVSDQRPEMLEMQELLEQTVSLFIDMAKTSDRTDASAQIRHSSANFAPLVEQMSVIVPQMCRIDIARPMAVRKGLLKILISWMRSQDREKIRCAVISINELTSTRDSYMAGWIHSQIVNEGALHAIVKLPASNSMKHDVRLAVAQILCRLCVAPHTRAAVVDANCIQCLISLLYDAETPSQEVAFAAGNAILQLLTGAMMSASPFSSEELTSAGKRENVVR